MLIESVRIKRFKSISDLTLPLDRVTVLVGSNNAGKSSVLQAIQFGVSTVQSLARTAGAGRRSGTLSVDQLVYTPLRDPSALAQGGSLVQSRERQIEVGFNTNLGNASVNVRRGKNSNLSVATPGDPAILAALQELKRPFSAFTPGLAGIPPVEEFRAPGVVRRAAAYGDANSVFRNVLWLLKEDRAGWGRFSERMERIFPDVKLELTYDGENDAVMKASVIRNAVRLPIDASGTGILQAAQILSYIGVYRPKLLTLDEPDSHLHPSNQRLLIRLLGEVAEEDDFQVLLSTHSRHLLDECIDMGASIRWMASGQLQENEVSRLPVLLSLGALDVGDRIRNGQIETVVLTEDSRTKYIERILASSGRDMGKTKVWSYGGCTQLSAAKVLTSFLEDLAPGCEVIIHRDRDYLSDFEIRELRSAYERGGFKLFVTVGTDIESHFLSLEHLSRIYSSRSEAEINALLDEATQRAEERSIRIMTNVRHEEALKNWDRRNRRPEAGNTSAETRTEYATDPVRFRHGKETLKEFSKLVEAKWGGTLDVVVGTDALYVEELAPSDEK